MGWALKRVGSKPKVSRSVRSRARSDAPPTITNHVQLTRDTVTPKYSGRLLDGGYVPIMWPYRHVFHASACPSLRTYRSADPCAGPARAAAGRSPVYTHSSMIIGLDMPALQTCGIVSQPTVGEEECEPQTPIDRLIAPGIGIFFCLLAALPILNSVIIILRCSL